MNLRYIDTLEGEKMKYLKILVTVLLSLTLLFAMGCSKADKTETAKTEPVVEEVVLAAAEHVPTAEEIGTESVCSMCGMAVTVTETTPSAEYDEKSYFFCSADEKEKFMADPVKALETPSEMPMDMDKGEGEGEGSGK